MSRYNAQPEAQSVQRARTSGFRSVHGRLGDAADEETRFDCVLRRRLLSAFAAVKPEGTEAPRWFPWLPIAMMLVSFVSIMRLRCPRCGHRFFQEPGRETVWATEWGTEWALTRECLSCGLAIGTPRSTVATAKGSPDVVADKRTERSVGPSPPASRPDCDPEDVPETIGTASRSATTTGGSGNGSPYA